MKKIKQNALPAVAKTLAGSILLSSCSPNLGMLEPEDILSTRSESTAEDSTAVSIRLHLSEDVKQTLSEIAPLVKDIIAHPEMAKALSSDPDQFCKDRGYAFTFNLEKDLLNLIIAFGDDDINKALNNNDVEQFIKLCSERNLFNSDKILRLKSSFSTEEEQEIYNLLFAGTENATAVTRSVAAYAVAVVVAIVAVAAVVLEVYIVGEEESVVIDKDLNKPSPVPLYGKSLMHSEKYNFGVMDIWALKNKSVSEFQLLSSYKNEIAEQAVSALKSYRPDLFQEYSEIQILEFIKKNMIV